MIQITPTGHGEAGKWNGTPVEGSRFTLQQQTALAQVGIRDLATVPTRTVKLKKPRERTAADIACGRPLEDCFDQVEVECPIVGNHRTRDGVNQVIVIAPGGDRVPLRR